MTNWSGPLWKEARTDRKRRQTKLRRDLARDERAEKAKVRRRDKGCRFPLCGCRALGLRTEVSHDWHKGRNGLETKRVRSTAAGMIELCDHRHQYGVVSRGRGTLRNVPITSAGDDGPVQWEIDVSVLPGAVYSGTPVWEVVAVETGLRQYQPFTPWQKQTLQRLAQMDL